MEINGGGIINENERLILTCQVDSYPSIDYYQWYRNHEKLNISSLSSSLSIEKVSKDDAGIYICMVKNTLKYANGSAIEKFNKTQTKVIIQCKKRLLFHSRKFICLFTDAPKVFTPHPILAEDLSASNIVFQCEIDSNPESTIHWKFNNKILFNSPKYTIVRNHSMSYLILQQIQSTFDYGYYSCNASNKLGYNSTHIQLRSKGNERCRSDRIYPTVFALYSIIILSPRHISPIVHRMEHIFSEELIVSIIYMSVVLHLAVPESVMNLNMTSVSYSTITVQWQAGFDGGWKQIFQVTLDQLLSKETNQTQFTFTSNIL